MGPREVARELAEEERYLKLAGDEWDYEEYIVNLEDNLNLLYSIFNKLLFKDKLPRVLVKVASIKDPDTRGFFAYQNKKPIGIVISKKDPEPIRVLVHEMCHVYESCVKRKWTGKDHSPGFVRKLSQVYRKLGFKVDPSEIAE